jgi:hypothetical protein
MAKAYGKNYWALILLLLAGIVVGSFLGHLAKKYTSFDWLDYGLNFAIGDKNNNNIFTLDLLGVLVLNFGFRINITIGSIVGIIAAIIIYKKVL